MIALLLTKKTTSIASLAILLGLGILRSSIPTSAQETPVRSLEEVPNLEVPEGNIQDLEGLEEKNASQWPWGVGGEYETSPETSDADSLYQIGSESDSQGFPVKLERQQKEWQNPNPVDYTPSTTTFPVTEF